jgi:hypothetical protein
MIPSKCEQTTTKTSVNHMSSEGLASRMYKELLNSMKKKSLESFEKMTQL